MKPAMIMLAGLGLMVVVFAAEFYVATIVFLLGCLTLLLILGGTMIPAHSHGSRLAFPAAEPGSFIPEWPCLEGTKIDPHRYQLFEFRIEVQGTGLVAIIGIATLYAMKLVIEKRGNPFLAYHEVGQSGDYVLFYVLVFASVVPVTIAAMWFFERTRLARSKVTIGSLDPRTGGYTFRDQHGAQFGGTRKPVSPKPEDNICVVFYGPKNPNTNTSSAGLLFHRLRIQPLIADAG